MDCCHYCEHKFSSFSDFPILYLERLERLEIPKSIKDRLKREITVSNPLIPPQVLEHFKNSREEILYEGKIYSSHGLPKRLLVYEDKRSKIDLALNNPVIKEAIDSTFGTLESLVGKEIRTNVFQKLLGFKENRWRKVITKSKDNKFLWELDMRNKSTRKVMGKEYDINKIIVSLSGDITYLHLGGISYSKIFEISVDLAQLTYEGRINSHSEIPVQRV